MKTALSRHMGQESPWHYFWVTLLAAALALILAIAATAREPFDSMTGEWNQAVECFQTGEFARAEVHLRNVVDSQAGYPGRPAIIDQGLLIWQALVAQADGRHLTAEHCWHRIELPHEQAVWKRVALASLYLEQGMVDEAAEQLDRANEQAPDNPVVHYFTALLHLERAAMAQQWPDARGPSAVRFALFQTDVVPNTRSMYLLAASQSLEDALKLPALAEDDPLIGIRDTVEPALRPTVADLLVAVGAAGYQVRAHHVASSVYLERGLLPLAEQHLDAAADGGATVITGYRELGEAYEADGDHSAAGRAYLKAAGYGDSPVGNLRRAWWHLRESTRQ